MFGIEDFHYRRNTVSILDKSINSILNEGIKRMVGQFTPIFDQFCATERKHYNGAATKEVKSDQHHEHSQTFSCEKVVLLLIRLLSKRLLFYVLFLAIFNSQILLTIVDGVTA